MELTYERICKLQDMINDYLKSKNMLSINEMLQTKGLEEEPGKLTNEHIIILQSMVYDYCNVNNKDINALMKEVNLDQGQIQGQISDFEELLINDLLTAYENLE